MEDAKGTPNPLPRSQASTSWRIKDDTPRAPPLHSGDPQEAYPENSAIDATSSITRLYVGNLIYTLQPAQLESFFIDNGFQIGGMTMSIDPFTGRNPSYAFVDFHTAVEAERAMKTLDGEQLLGRPTRIKPNVENTKGKDSFQSRTRNWNRDWGKSQELKEG